MTDYKKGIVIKMAQTDWMNDPAVRHIAQEKLMFLQKMVFESQSLSQKELMPFLMALAAKSKKQNISFNDQETTVIIDTLKKYASPAELEKMNQVLSLRKYQS